MEVFLCHSSGDKPVVRTLCEKLKAEGFVPWLDEKDLLPGQWWEMEIRMAIDRAGAIVVCLSNGSISQERFLQREIRLALDKAAETPDDTIFLIPARLEKCSIPVRLNEFQWVDLFEDSGYPRLLQALADAGSNSGAAPITQASVVNAVLKSPRTLKGRRRKFTWLLPIRRCYFSRTTSFGVFAARRGEHKDERARFFAGRGFWRRGAVLAFLRVRELEFDFDVLAFNSYGIVGDILRRRCAEDAAGGDIKDCAVPRASHFCAHNHSLGEAHLDGYRCH